MDLFENGHLWPKYGRLGERSLFDARHHHLPGQRLSLNYIEYGAKTLIAPG